MTNKLNQLIQQYCPDGVEFIKLGEVCELLRWKRLTKSQLSDNGQYTVYHGWLIPLGYYHEYNREANTVMVINTWSVWEVWWSAEPFWSSDGTFTIKCPDFIQDKYLYYVLKTKEKSLKKEIRSGWVPTIDRLTVEKQLIPIPPLPIQEEIVKILDKFTSLEAELEAELEARKCQYEFYRNQILAFDKDEIEWKTLREVVKIKNGKDRKGLGIWDIPVYGSGGEMGIFVNTYAYDKPTVLIPRKGSISNIFYLEKPFWNVDTVYYTEINEHVLRPKFFYYFISTINLEKFSLEATRPSLTQSILEKIKIPLPPLEQQEAIVYILDHFDQLANDLTVGLPAELHLRQQQYAYYRDVLLNFSSELALEREH